MQRWIAEAAHMLSEPGAQSVEEQLAGCARHDAAIAAWLRRFLIRWLAPRGMTRSEEHTSELQSLMRNSYAVVCLNRKSRKTPHKPIKLNVQHNYILLSIAP